MRAATASRGFTLLEVLVALVVVAFGMGALMATLTSAADSVGHLRDKSFAEWIALNRISEMRLRANAPPIGRTSGELEYAGGRWRWTQDVERTTLGNMLRIDVSVARAEGDKTRQQVQLAMATGFIGASLTRSDGKTPAWDSQALRVLEQAGQQAQTPGGAVPVPAPPQRNPQRNPQASQ